MTPEQEGRLLNGVDEIRDRLLRIEASCGPCQLTVKENREAIKGNGKPGLITEMAVHTQVIEELRGEMSNNTKWLRGTLLTIISAIVGLLWYLVTGQTPPVTGA